MVAENATLATPGNVFTSASVSLCPSEEALAVLLSPFSGTCSVGLLPLDAEAPGLESAAAMRWLDMPNEIRATCVEWTDELLFVGCNRGRVFISDTPKSAASEGGGGPFVPCGALFCSQEERPVSEIVISHSAHAMNTAVRSVRVNRGVNESLVLGLRGRKAYVWDLEGSPSPVTEWAPHEESTDTAPVMFGRWAPGSASVVLTGTYEGNVMLVDTRANNTNNGLTFAVRKGYACSSGDFNPLLPSIFAAASCDGTFSLFDVRYTSHAILSVPSLQGDISTLKWMNLNSDLLVTGGTDGTVALWNIRSPPTFCVGRAQYSYSVADLVTTETFLDQRALSISIGGELTSTGLHMDAMMKLAPYPMYGRHASPDSASTDAELAEMEERETAACGFLYTRQLRDAFTLLAQCAEDRLSHGDTEIALKVVGMMDVSRVPPLDYSSLIQSKVENSDSPLTVSDVRQAFELLLERTSTHLTTTIALTRIRGLEKPDSLDLRKLEALRLNIMLSQVLATQDPDKVAIGVEKALELLATHPESFELIDGDIVCGIVSLLLKKNFEAGERFVKFLLSKLSTPDLLTMAMPLLKRILCTAQEPLITADNSRYSRRFSERFFRDLPAAQDAVLTQLTITRLGIENYKEVTATVNAYQARCIEKDLPGIHRWLGVKPILLFLHCLAAESNYVSFFWSSVQCIQAYEQFPAVRQIENVLFAVVNRINTAAGKIADQLNRLADTERLTIPILRQIDNALKTAHGFLVVLVRVQLECENVAIDSDLGHLPPLMETILDVLNNASEDVLEMWGSVVDLLIDAPQPDMVKKYCLSSIRDFSFSMEDLMEVSAKGEDDEQLNSILDVCDDFLDAMTQQ
ncbi:hypothetical protein AGDE_09397 [Angomonas deanei]|uniref:Uncharacterized protein n=1 Tax=Angomonas deanei TaxID=59799 RepID=A0A7G2CSB6_9TRYP|nr:hypothetical protein AGDE_09397 [Angomonas deanei]CAD2221092.1 hypothetical protein, conserved [Angomonas deanei]|eukprot:EPY30530.1 hypothetical protein AGDE_09397 [Angomonas deanei]